MEGTWKMARISERSNTYKNQYATLKYPAIQYYSYNTNIPSSINYIFLHLSLKTIQLHNSGSSPWGSYYWTYSNGLILFDTVTLFDIALPYWRPLFVRMSRMAGFSPQAYVVRISAIIKDGNILQGFLWR